MDADVIDLDLLSPLRVSNQTCIQTFVNIQNKFLFQFVLIDSLVNVYGVTILAILTIFNPPYLSHIKYET